MSDKFDLHCYDDIIDMPHYTSPSRKRMDMTDRAAQFSPFAALTGYESAVQEAARLTEEKRELSDDMKAIIDTKVRLLAEHLDEAPRATVTYFVPDVKKDGGAYINISGEIKSVDEYGRCIVMMNQTRIHLDQIRDIDSELFRCLEIDS